MRTHPHQLLSGGLVVPPFSFRRHLLSLVSADLHYALCTFNSRTTNHGCSLAFAFLCPVVIETLHRSLPSSPSLGGHAAGFLCSCKRKDVPSSKVAVELVVETLMNGDKADAASLVGAVVAAARLRNPRLGRWAHGIAVKGWMPWNPHLGSALVGMYGKCGCLGDSHQAFVEMPERNLVCCNAMMDAFARSGSSNLQEGSSMIWVPGILCPGIR